MQTYNESHRLKCYCIFSYTALVYLLYIYQTLLPYSSVFIVFSVTLFYMTLVIYCVGETSAGYKLTGISILSVVVVYFILWLKK